MATTEGMSAERNRVVWKMTPEEARQLATLIEMAEVDPFNLKKYLVHDLRTCATEAFERGHAPEFGNHGKGHQGQFQ